MSRATSFCPIRGKKYLRKMRGGSQSCLIRAEDDNLYIIKMLGNPQGSQILFHEALGTQLMGQIGLPVPAWSLIELTAEFIESNSELWFDIGTSRRYPPKAGLHFGSKLTVADLTAYEFLPPKWLAQVVNRSDFVGALLFDLWCSHDDRRQAVFIPGTGRDLEAVFIDQGALFSDVKCIDRRANLRAMYWDSEVYAGLDVGDLLPLWESRIRGFDLVKFERDFRAIGLPSEWYTPVTASKILSKLKRRQKSLGRLSSSIREALNSVIRQMSGAAWGQQRETIRVCGLRM